MKILLIHGIHSKEGDHNMSALFPHIKAYATNAEVELFEYGFMGFWKARWDNDRVARLLAAKIKQARLDGHDVTVITHSNGAAITYLASEKYAAIPDMIVNINPALDRHKTSSAERVITIHAENDRAVYFSQWLPFHIWGDQGKVGYKGSKHNVENINASKLQDSMAYYGHCGLFGSPRIASWAAYIANRIALNFLHRNRG
jgi:pimeloyl-ACP methyl ester carboxylesterase